MDKQAIEALLTRMVYLPITIASENETIEFSSRFRSKLPDSIIAATVKQHDLELLTLDKQLLAFGLAPRRYD